MKIKLGEKLGEGLGAAAPSEPEQKDKLFYPSLHITSKGGYGKKPKKGRATIEYEIVSETERDEGGKTTFSCQLDVHSIEFGKGGEASKTDRAGNEAMKEHFTEKAEEEEDEEPVY